MKPFVLLVAVLPLVAETICPVKKAGAVGIQEAIDACAAQGGGVAYVPAGERTSGPFWMKDNVELRLEAGAVIRLSQNGADWPKGVRALVNSKGAKRFAITGRGVFDGNARWAYEPVKRVDIEIAAEQETARLAGVEMKRYYRTGDGQKYLFVLQESEDIRIEGVTIRNAPLWNVRIQDCDRVWIRGIHLYSDLERGVNSDGIDIVSSSNVTISDSVIITADDAICLKTVDLDHKGQGAVRPVENVLVTNCVLGSSSTPMMIGTETHADIRHVVFSNIIVRDSNKVFGINVQDGATVSDVRFSNVTFETNRRHWNWWGSAELMKFVLKKRTPESRLGRIEHITVDGAQGTARGTSLVAGHAERMLEDIRIANVQLRMLEEKRPDKRATHALVFERVKGLELRNVRVEWDRERPEPMWGSALVLRDIDGLELRGFAGEGGGAGAPGVVRERVRERDTAQEERLRRFNDAKFGMFIHWGPYSLASVEASWPIMRPGKWGISEADYRALPGRFNPVEFDARAWVRLAKAAGQRYMVFTTKHHDGFSMYDTAYSDYKITKTPYGKDIVKQLAEAARAEGMPLGFYYSPPDLDHPGFRDTSKLSETNWQGEPRRPEWASYLDYMELQLRELLTGYGDVFAIWFDGLGQQQKYGGARFHALIYGLQPATLINNRIGLTGDFVTPEQRLPKGIPRRDSVVGNTDPNDRGVAAEAPKPEEFQPWETCMTINGTWGYNRNDREFKSTTELVRALIDAASKGGNFLLNVGPTPEGTIQPEFEERLRGMGAWLAVNGESIYGTTYGPVQGWAQGRMTAKGRTLYLHVFEQTGEVVELDGVPGKVTAVKVMNGGAAVPFEQAGGKLTLRVGQVKQDAHATVFVIERASAE